MSRQDGTTAGEKRTPIDAASCPPHGVEIETNRVTELWATTCVSLIAALHGGRTRERRLVERPGGLELRREEFRGAGHRHLNAVAIPIGQPPRFRRQPHPSRTQFGSPSGTEGGSGTGAPISKLVPRQPPQGYFHTARYGPPRRSEPGVDLRRPSLRPAAAKARMMRQAVLRTLDKRGSDHREII